MNTKLKRSHKRLKNKILNTFTRFSLSAFVVASFFFTAPIFINFADKNFNNKEFTNNSKNILNKTINNGKVFEEDDGRVQGDEMDLLYDILDENNSEINLVRYTTSEINALFNEVKYDLAEVRDNPHKSSIRRGPLLYNIFDSKSEGIATGVEEMFMQLGLYQDSPRSKEIVWIMLAQRAARGLGSLYAHANMMTMEEAGNVHVKWTPRGWMEREPHLLRFEQHLYLRQPGYGTCYITGKYLIERLITEVSKKLETEGKEL